MKKCNHIIGFSQLIDSLIWEDEKDRYKYLSTECEYSPLDFIFNYCPECGEKLDVKI